MKNDYSAVTLEDYQSCLPFSMKTPKQHLTRLANDFDFSIDDSIIQDHTHLSEVRYYLNQELESPSVYGAKATSELYFQYALYGRKLLQDHDLQSKIITKIIKRYNTQTVLMRSNLHSMPFDIDIDELPEDTAAGYINKYHFLGYGRSESVHLGLISNQVENNRIIAIASISGWDINHVSAFLPNDAEAGDKVIVLSRLLPLPGAPQNTSSIMISYIRKWLHKNKPHIRYLVTYCNPNAGHYGTVYRGSNFIPMCYEEHAFIPFQNKNYLSPRKYEALIKDGTARKTVVASTIKPLPLLLYILPLRGRNIGEVNLEDDARGTAYPYSYTPPTQSKRNESSVSIDKTICTKIANQINKIALPENLIHQKLPFSSKQEIGNFNLFLVAICHQTQSLEGYIGDHYLRGWDYLEAKLANAFERNKDLFDIRAWETLTPEILQSYLSCSKLGDTLSDIENRINLLHDLSRTLSKLGVKSFWSLSKESRHQCVTGKKSIFEVLNKTKAYCDPVEKKSKLLVSILRDAHNWIFKDVCLVGAPIDYHEIRGHLRLNTLRLVNTKIGKKIVDGATLSQREDVLIRQHVSEANEYISAQLCDIDPLKLHYILWYVFRYLCRREQPLCHASKQIEAIPTGSASVVFQNLSSKAGCPFSSFCGYASSDNFMIEYTTKTDFY